MKVRNLFIIGLVLTALASCTSPVHISVLQFNIWQEGTKVPGGFEAIADEIARLKPDFVTLSETRNYQCTRFCDRITEALAERGETYYSFYSYDSGILSRHPITDSTLVIMPEGDHGSIYRINASVQGHEFAIYTAHLDYLNEAYYEPRGYDGNTWEPLPSPITHIDTLMSHSFRSYRDEEITAFLKDALRQRDLGRIVILGGDFNEPSHLDWTYATQDLFDHNGVIASWQCTLMLSLAGFEDAYRDIYPDPVTHPGFTFPSANPAVPFTKLAWAPLADERDRIDFIIYDAKSGSITPTNAFILGPRECVYQGTSAIITGADSVLTPISTWPSDHRAVLAEFTVIRK